MEPIDFKERNVVYGTGQPEYKPLPALSLDDPHGTVISCWRLSIKERLKVLFTGKIWVGLLCFGKPLTPSMLSTKIDDILPIKINENDGK